MARTDPQFNARLTPENLDRLKAAAEAAGKSLTATLNDILALRTHATTTVKTQIRIPAHIYNQLLDSADMSGRSMNSEMVERIASSFH